MQGVSECDLPQEWHKRSLGSRHVAQIDEVVNIAVALKQRQASSSVNALLSLE